MDANDASVRWTDVNGDGSITAEEKSKAATENAAAEAEQAAEAGRTGNAGKGATKVKRLARAVS